MFLPNNELAKQDQVNLALKLKNSLVKSASTLKEDIRKEAYSYLNDLKNPASNGIPYYLQDPDVFVINNKLTLLTAESSHCKTDTKDLIFSIKDLVSNNIKSHEFALDHFQIPVNFEIDKGLYEEVLLRASNMAESSSKISAPFYTLSKEEVRNSLESVVQKAFDLIKSSWPEFWEEFLLLTKKVIFFKRPKTIGFADFYCQGAIFINIDYIPTPLHLAELLVHETTHIRLNAYMAQNDLFKNDDREIYKTPLRIDLRPMYGVIHQYFVLARLVFFFRKISTLPVDFQNLLEKYSKDKAALLETICNSAILTDAGKLMLSETEHYTA